jgi:hypothetical protein
MTRLALVGSSILLLVVSGGCAGRSPQAAQAARPAADEPRGPVIVHLVGQHQKITVTSGPDGPLYTARTTDGQTVVANATLKELREQHPEVYRLVEPTMAVHADIRGAVPDSSKPAPTHGPVEAGEIIDAGTLLDSRR